MSRVEQGHTVRWSLHDRAFRGLLWRLDPDPTVAGERYEQLRRTLVQIFDWRGALAPDACADETIDRLARKIANGTAVGDVTAFAHGIARMVLFEQRRRPETRAISLDDAVGVGERASGDDDEAVDERLLCLEQCLAELDATSRALILRYYGHPREHRIDGRAALARELGLSATALRSRAQRIRDRLERRASARGWTASRHARGPGDSTHVTTARPRLPAHGGVAVQDTNTP